MYIHIIVCYIFIGEIGSMEVDFYVQFISILLIGFAAVDILLLTKVNEHFYYFGLHFWAILIFFFLDYNRNDVKTYNFLFWKAISLCSYIVEE
jgi:hypothetical protein